MSLWLSPSRPAVFLGNFRGLANRLEALNLAFAIQAKHGHTICLDWPELDALRVLGTEKCQPGPVGRMGAKRLHECPAETFEALATQKRILLRTYAGPREVLQACLPHTAARILPTPEMARAIEDFFAREVGTRPVVGVHIRRGDFAASEGAYDVNASPHSAVPLWWYQRAMAALQELNPDVVFFLSISGPGSEFAELAGQFPVVRAPMPDPYHAAHPGHGAATHPIFDLFALASCPVILGTPVSSYTHYAAHLLGPPSVCLIPPGQVEPATFGIRHAPLAGHLLADWTQACRKEYGQLPAMEPAELEWEPARLSWMQYPGRS